MEQLKCWLEDLMAGMACSGNQEACLDLLKNAAEAVPEEMCCRS